MTPAGLVCHASALFTDALDTATRLQSTLTLTNYIHGHGRHNEPVHLTQPTILVSASRCNCICLHAFTLFPSFVFCGLVFYIHFFLRVFFFFFCRIDYLYILGITTKAKVFLSLRKGEFFY